MPISKTAKVYIQAMILAGLLVFGGAMSQWEGEQSIRFLVYLLGDVLTSNLKVRLPGVTGTMSVNFLFILLAVLELNFPQTVLIACIGVLAQSLWRAQVKPKAVQLAFNVAGITLSAAAAYGIYHARWMQAMKPGDPILLFLATGTYFFVNTASVSVVIALTEGKSPVRVWQESFGWTAPQYLVGAVLAGAVHALNYYAGWQFAVFAMPVIYLVYRSYDLYLSRLEQQTRHASEKADLHWRTIEALALAIDAKDDTTHDHLQRVQIYATEIGKELKLNEPEMLALRASALLHDIGKLAVPEHIISKPGKLTPEEFEKMKIHPVVGAEILERVGFPYPVVPIVRSHHEKWNGTGYPDGLVGEQIPVGARILAVVDCLDALASDRQYRKALPLDKAMEIVARDAGTAFDPRVVEVLGRRYVELERTAKASPVEETKLSTNAKIERGAAPAAGFEAHSSIVREDSCKTVLDSIGEARREFQMLLEVLHELGSSLSLDDTLSVLAARLKRMIPHDSIAIYLSQSGKLRPQFAAGEDFRVLASLAIPMGHGLSGWVAENGKSIINGNPAVEPGYVGKMRSALAVPLEGIDGIVGVLTLYRAEPDAFNKDHLRMLLTVSAKAGLTIENALKYKQAENSAVTDELTGLPNARSLFSQLDGELAQAKRSQSTLALLVLDIDQFRLINDHFGHLTGDRVLQAVGRGLREVCRDYDAVTRVGGDEFVVILPKAKRDGLAGKMEQLRKAAIAAAQAHCDTEPFSVSIGEAFFPDDGADAEQLLAKADRRMYASKQVRRSSSALVRLAEETSAGVLVNP